MSADAIGKTIGTVSDTIRYWSDTYEIPFSTSFSITGGEPFLKGDLASILKKVAGAGFAVSVLTNGTLIDRDKARMLADTPVRGVQVSLEGPEPVHESIRGKKSFSSALKGVRYLTDAGVQVTLNVTLSQLNVDYFTDMIALAGSLSVPYLGFSRLVPFGRGLNLLSGMLTRERIKEVYEEIFSLETPGLEIVTGDPLASQLRHAPPDDREDAFPSGGCAAGVSGMTLLPDGTITPCRRLRIPVGNILKDPLRQVWAASDVLNALRNKGLYKGKCRTCARWSNCRGCRAIAYAWSLSQGRGDLLEEDPQCFIV